MITIACVLKSGGDFTIDYVIKLKSMILRNVTIPYDFVCLTDYGISEDICKTIKLENNFRKWWSKIELFRPNIINTERIVYFDLDTLILRNIDNMLMKNDEFIALKPWNRENKLLGRFASGIMSWKNDGSFSFIYDEFKEDSICYGGDQRYIFRMLNKHKREFSLFDNCGVYSYKRDCKNAIPYDARVICFHGKPRLPDINKSWVVNNWR